MTSIERLPPQNREAEEAVLGSMLIDPDAIFEVANFLNVESFYNVANRWIYESILTLHQRNDPVDSLTVIEELRRRDQLEEIGGEAYIIGLVSAVPTSINAKAYGQIVEAAALRRELINAASTIANLAYEEDEDINVVIDRSEQTLFAISEQRTTRDLTPVKQIAQDYLARIEELHARGQDIVGVPTGFVDMDRLLGGLNKSDLIILAARPGMGKCVTADTKIVNPETGELTDIETLVQQQNAPLLTLNSKYKLQKSEASHFVDSGIKPVFRVQTALGREIKATAKHPFLLLKGWRPLYQIQVGDRIAVPREVPVFGRDDALEHEVKTLAYLLADGCVTETSPQFTNSNPEVREDFVEAALHFSGNKARLQISGERVPTIYITQDRQYKSADRAGFTCQLVSIMEERRVNSSQLARQMAVSPVTVQQWSVGKNFPSAENFGKLCEALSISEFDLLPNGHAEASRKNNTLTLWLKELGVWGKSAAEKVIPTAVYRYTREKLALFLNRLFACDGSIYLQNKTQPVVSYTSASKELAAGVRHLLLRFGIIAKLRERQIPYRDEFRTAYQVRVTDAAGILVFVNEIGAFGKEEACDKVRQRCEETYRNSNLDTIPVDVWEQIRDAKGDLSWAEVQRRMGLSSSHNLHVGKRSPSRPRLMQIANALECESLAELAQSEVYWDEVVAIEPLGEQQVYDLTVPETHNFVADDMIVHNTSLQNAIALTAARTYNKRIAIFNLEMSGEQLVQRMLASETRVDIQRLRRGQLHDHEWPIFYEAVQRLSETRIFIDDTPSISPMQLRTKCRRLYAEHGIDLVMIDYLQLMQSDRGSNNRVQEIGEISRGLKQLARELDVPVLAAAQLSRAVESRQDKRPMLSDLRDSGCLTGDTLVPLADTGERVAMRELCGRKDFYIWALNEETLKLEKAVVSNAFSTGVKPIYRLITRLGRTIRATGNHKFRSFDGWKRLDELVEGDRLALPRVLPTEQVQTLTNEQLALMAHLIGDGCTLPRHAIQYTTREEDLARDVASLATYVFGDELKPKIKKERQWFQVYLSSTRRHTHGVRNVVSEWFDELGIFGLRSHEKFVPEEVFTQSAEAIDTFLRHLWSTDGCIRMRKSGSNYYPAVYYATSSNQLAYDVQSLLLRVGINARVKVVSQGEKGRDQYHVIVSGHGDLSLFVERIGTVGAYKQESLDEIAGYLNEKVGNTNRDVIPATIWRQHVVPAMQVEGMTGRQMQAAINQPYCGTSLYKQNVSRTRAAVVAEAVDSLELTKLAESDVYWDKIVSIEPDGEEEVFDLTVPVHHNFVADDIVVHNSIEQDADIVMFIYRDEYYNPDTTDRPGIAEINVAKHRNGPTASIDLYWNGELASFANLQRQEVQL